MTPDRQIPRRAVGRSAATAFLSAIFAALSALPVAAEVPPWQLPPAGRSQHFVDRPNRHAERRSGGVVSFVPPGEAGSGNAPTAWPDRSRVIPARPGANRGIVQKTSYQSEGEPQADVSGEIISEGAGPVLYGGDGSVIYEDGAPMMGDPGGFVSQRRAMEDYWNSPASDRGYPCYPVWLPLRDHLYLRGEYLLWWAKGSTLAPWPGVVDGGIFMNNGSRSGARVTLGYWVDLCRFRGFEATYLTLHSRGDQYINGNATLEATSKLDGLEALFRRAIHANACNRFDMVLGYRTLYLEDDLRINVQAADIEHIGTTNRFNGFELGFGGRVRRYRWTLDMQMKLALGNTHSNIRSQFFNAEYDLDNFAMVSELGATLGYHLTPRLRATVGYTFLYWSVVARPGDQVTFLPPDQTVRVTTDYWAQGLNAGLEWQF